MAITNEQRNRSVVYTRGVERGFFITRYTNMDKCKKKLYNLKNILMNIGTFNYFVYNI